MPSWIVSITWLTWRIVRRALDFRPVCRISEFYHDAQAKITANLHRHLINVHQMLCLAPEKPQLQYAEGRCLPMTMFFIVGMHRQLAPMTHDIRELGTGSLCSRLTAAQRKHSRHTRPRHLRSLVGSPLILIALRSELTSLRYVLPIVQSPFFKPEQLPHRSFRLLLHPHHRQIDPTHLYKLVLRVSHLH